MLTTTKRLAPHTEPDDDMTYAARADERWFADVDDSSADSFPASDPPSWAGMRVGGPSL